MRSSFSPCRALFLPDGESLPAVRDPETWVGQGGGIAGGTWINGIYALGDRFPSQVVAHAADDGGPIIGYHRLRDGAFLHVEFQLQGTYRTEDQFDRSVPPALLKMLQLWLEHIFDEAIEFIDYPDSEELYL